MNPFTWLRTAAKNAVLGGIEDAIAEAAPTLETVTVSRIRLAIPDTQPTPAIEPPADESQSGKKPKKAN